MAVIEDGEWERAHAVKLYSRDDKGATVVTWIVSEWIGVCELERELSSSEKVMSRSAIIKYL